MCAAETDLHEQGRPLDSPLACFILFFTEGRIDVRLLIDLEEAMPY